MVYEAEDTEMSKQTIADNQILQHTVHSFRTLGPSVNQVYMKLLERKLTINGRALEDEARAAWG